MSTLASNSNCNHNNILIEQRQTVDSLGKHFNLCTKCGFQSPLEDSCVIEISHQHDYTIYYGITGCYYMMKCSHFDCNAILQIRNPELYENNNNQNTDNHYNHQSNHYLD